MKKFAILLIASISLFAQSGEELFKNKCSMCHKVKIPNSMENLIAPPAFAITMHVKKEHPNLKEFTNFVQDYVINPSKEKALCAKKTVKRFGVMPSQKNSVTKEELSKIAKYLYSNFAKNSFEENHKMLKKKMNIKE